MTAPAARLQAPDGGPLDVDAVAARLGKGFDVVLGGSHVVRRTCLDTFDRLLRAADFTLEQTTDVPGGRLVLTKADGTVVATPRATGLRWPMLAGGLPAGAVREAVAPVSGIRALTVVSDDRRRVRRVTLRNKDQKTVVRLEIEEATAPTSHLPAVVTVHPLRGYEDQAARAVTILLAQGLEPAPLQVQAPTRPAPVPVVTDRDAPGALLLGQMLGGFLAAMTENLPGLLDDIDTEFLHDFRVAVRRTRSTLKLGRPVLPEEFRSTWEPAFKWLGDLTTPVRDLDVYELDLPTMSSWLVAADPADLAPFARLLRRRRTAERRALVRGLKSARYQHLVADWASALAELVARADPAADAAEPPAERPLTAGQLADRSIAKAYKRVARDGHAITHDSPATDLHQLRKRCKELRYAFEVFAPVIDNATRKQAVADLKALQDVLGRFQDSEVQRQALRTFAEEMMTDGSPAAAVLAMGELIGHLDVEQDRARDEFASAFARFVRPANHARIQHLGGAS